MKLMHTLKIFCENFRPAFAKVTARQHCLLYVIEKFRKVIDSTRAFAAVLRISPNPLTVLLMIDC